METQMRFLPLEINGNRSYATFFQRLGAALIDVIILFALIFLSSTLESSNFTLAATVRFGLPIILGVYYIVFNAKYGGTIGKLLMGIQITKKSKQEKQGQAHPK